MKKELSFFTDRIGKEILATNGNTSFTPTIDTQDVAIQLCELQEKGYTFEDLPETPAPTEAAAITEDQHAFYNNPYFIK